MTGNRGNVPGHSSRLNVIGTRARIGDGVAFYGRELSHSRPVLPEGRRSTSLLLHFVPEGFAGPLD